MNVSIGVYKHLNYLVYTVYLFLKCEINKKYILYIYISLMSIYTFHHYNISLYKYKQTYLFKIKWKQAQLLSVQLWLTLELAFFLNVKKIYMYSWISKTQNIIKLYSIMKKFSTVDYYHLWFFWDLGIFFSSKFNRV